ncbi:MAG: Uma2 family endonuclease [Chloroflexi bacterium]|nr:Uma2 family endonuclease [Chloroflexota bacterium]
MEVKQRLYDVDDLWELYCRRSNDHLRFELIDGDIIEMSGPGGVHGELALTLGSYIRAFAKEHALGRTTVETGYHPAEDRYNLLLPDVAYISFERAPEPFPEKFVPAMPESAVEIKSPSNTLAELREKAGRYLRMGSTLIWIVLPAEESVEVCRLAQSGEIKRAVFGPGDALSGAQVLPGFTLDLSQIFE